MAERSRGAPAVSFVIADVDGALVTHDKVLTPRALAAVERLRRAGIGFAVTSGRPPRGMTMLVEPLGLDTPIAGFNGGMFVTPGMDVLEEHRLAPEAARRAFGVIERCGLDVWIYTGQQWLVRDAHAPHVAREQWTVRFAPTVVADLAPALEHAIKIVGVSDDEDRVARCEGQVQQALGAGASAARSQPYYLDVTHPDANKGTVVATLARMRSIPPARIATIGDMPNDILMFRRGGLGIAMGNAAAEVKQAADAVTDSCDDDGFAKAMERFVLGRAPERAR